MKLARIAFLVACLGFESRFVHGQVYSLIHSFEGADGAGPAAGLALGSDGNFYGTTAGGGASAHGTIFAVDVAGNLRMLHSFNGTDGANPQSVLVEFPAGHFYGTTAAGGEGSATCVGDDRCGTVFEISLAGNLARLHSFNGSEGYGPLAGLARRPDGSFYGTTYWGGALGNPPCCGTVFRVDTLGQKTTLFSFSGQDGNGPHAGLALGADGYLYGTTEGGGTSNGGTVFKIDTAGNLTTLHSFGELSDGVGPIGGLTQGRDGILYGTTSEGGSSFNCLGGCGTIFKIDLAGNARTLHSFTGADGAGPSSELVQGRDGNYYGTTSYGGSGSNCFGGCGTIFEIDAAGHFATLHSFTGADGANPLAGLVEGSDGSFYGTTFAGGSSESCEGGCGTVFKISNVRCSASGNSRRTCFSPVGPPVPIPIGQSAGSRDRDAEQRQWRSAVSLPPLEAEEP